VHFAAIKFDAAPLGYYFIKLIHMYMQIFYLSLNQETVKKIWIVSLLLFLRERN